MVYHDRQSQGEWDFDLIRPDGTSEPVEVTVSTDQGREQIYAAVLEGEQFVPRTRSRHDWSVSPYQDARIWKIRKEVDFYLADIEAEGLTKFFSEIDAVKSEAVARIMCDLKVCAGLVTQWKKPGICIDLPGHGGWLGADRILASLEREANKPDNRRKLGKSKAPSRHLVVLIGHLNGPAWSSMLRGMMPEQSAKLPPEITMAWIAMLVPGTECYRLWRTSASLGWENLGDVSVSGCGTLLGKAGSVEGL